MINVIEFFGTIAYSITLMCILLEFEVKRIKGIWMMGLFMIILVVLGGSVWLSLGYESFMILYPIFVHLPLFIGFWFVSKYKGTRLFFVLLTVIVLSSPPVLIGHMVSNFYGYNHNIVSVVCLVMYLPMTVIVYKYFRPLFLYMLHHTKQGWITFCIIPLAYNGYTFLTGKYDVALIREEPLLWVDTTVTILIIAVYMIILRFFKQTREHLMMQNQQNILDVQVGALQERYQTMQELEKKTITYRHDLRHHIHLLEDYLADNNVAEIKKYIIETENNINKTATIKYCDNEAVNLILTPYITKAENQKIRVETQIYIPKNCEVADIDLCIILTNAIENAINASMHIKNINDRRIAISCKSKNNKLFIQVMNNFIGEVKFLEEMPISEKEVQGFRTKSIVATVDKYRGLYSFTAKEGVFKIRVIL